MDASEPHVRRRGFFLHSDTTGELDHTEHENPEGVVVRARGSSSSRVARRTMPRQVSSMALGGRSMTSSRDGARPQIRSGSVTGSRQRAHLPR
jgi:hypothetical protein